MNSDSATTFLYFINLIWKEDSELYICPLFSLCHILHYFFDICCNVVTTHHFKTALLLNPLAGEAQSIFPTDLKWANMWIIQLFRKYKGLLCEGLNMLWIMAKHHFLYIPFDEDTELVIVGLWHNSEAAFQTSRSLVAPPFTNMHLFSILVLQFCLWRKAGQVWTTGREQQFNMCNSS